MKRTQLTTTAQHRTLTTPTRPPRTTRGLLATIALPLLVLAGAGALTYPVVAVGLLAGLVAALAGYRVARGLVRRRARLVEVLADLDPTTA